MANAAPVKRPMLVSLSAKSALIASAMTNGSIRSIWEIRLTRNNAVSVAATRHPWMYSRPSASGTIGKRSGLYVKCVTPFVMPKDVSLAG